MKMAPADVLATRSDGETAVVAPSFKYCLGLYLITQRGARRALRKAFPLSAQLDTPGTGPLSSLDTATVIPPVAQCDERQATSGVQITTGAKPDDLSVHIPAGGDNPAERVEDGYPDSGSRAASVLRLEQQVQAQAVDGAQAGARPADCHAEGTPLQAETSVEFVIDDVMTLSKRFPHSPWD